MIAMTDFYSPNEEGLCYRCNEIKCKCPMMMCKKCGQKCCRNCESCRIGSCKSCKCVSAYKKNQSTVCDCKRAGIQVLLQGTVAPILADGDTLMFDTVLNQTGQEITYNIENGNFIISEPGSYKIHWHVIVGGSDTSRFVNFAIKVNGAIYCGFPLPVTVGLVSGDVVLTTQQPNSVVSLCNNTQDPVRLSRHLPSANIIITTL